MDTFDLGKLTTEQLIELIADARKVLYPQAIIVDGELLCSKCHDRCLPALVEVGMTVTHHLETISDGRVRAHGWDGTSSDVSEEGELLVLECSHCFKWHRIPEPIELEWL